MDLLKYISSKAPSYCAVAVEVKSKRRIGKKLILMG